MHGGIKYIDYRLYLNDSWQCVIYLIFSIWQPSFHTMQRMGLHRTPHFKFLSKVSFYSFENLCRILLYGIIILFLSVRFAYFYITYDLWRPLFFIVLKAIEQDSPAVPTLLTDYILKGNIHESSIAIISFYHLHFATVYKVKFCQIK